jgi:hypothetical protein
MIWTPGFTTENAEFMLEGNDVEVACIQKVGGMHVIFYSVIIDAKANDGWIVVGAAMIGHRHDCGRHVRA